MFGREQAVNRGVVSSGYPKETPVVLLLRLSESWEECIEA